jgi:hypothetical protein
MNKKIFFILLTACIAFGCDDESSLDGSIFVNDPVNPGLPKYSELGFNTFGAYYDRQSFTSGSIVPVKVIVEEGVTSFILNGWMMSHDVSLEIQLADFLPENYTDLLDLHNTTLNLEDADYTVVIDQDGTEYEAEILNGTFHFKRAQSLFVDKELFGVILSGTFEFQAIVDGEPITVSSGRFDVSVNQDNFYVIDIDP